MEPGWLHVTGIISIIVSFICALIIIIDEFRHKQKMWIMNLVWPLTALFGSVLWLWFYFSHGRATIQKKQPFPIMVAKAASHCGSGCTLGDICAEWLAFAMPAIAMLCGFVIAYPVNWWLLKAGYKEMM